MSKKTFKGSAMLNPVPAVLVTSKNKNNEINVFTVGWIGTATQIQTPFRKLVFTF
ncbi:hypothetical protein CLTEP_03850 [Clostridium tepidiprofundi DSM 19306]|uniref:Flavoredoxin n=1 Tax=Clostridium tepidiprofundi DSM 19306 TaxID=1121338 RepID=A0A151B7R7_9CLOT|nr:hypothetical protein CLTEP_03850 [Clostridium tepidiprofundi DSM 19306]